MPRVPTNGIDYTSRDYEGFRTFMLEKLSLKLPEYTDRSQTDAGIVLLELMAMGYDVLSYYLDSVANEVFLSTAEQRVNALKWCNILGYTPRNATPSKFEQVFVLSSIQATDTVIPAGTAVKTVGNAVENEVIFETEEDLTIPAGALGDETDAETDEYLYSATVVQGISISNELLGSSNGTADQSFTLKYSPAIVESIHLAVNEGTGFEWWEKVENFIDSTPDSKHFIVHINERDEAVITFGNGVFGKVPGIYADGLYSTYRVGGGVDGNVGANKIIELVTTIAKVDSTFNPTTPIEYGTDKETLDEIKVNAPIHARNPWGALTLEDFVSILKLSVPEILLAQAVQNETYPDNVVIYYMLQDGVTLTDELEERLDALFSPDGEGRGIIGTVVSFTEYTPYAINFYGLELFVHPYYEEAEVQANILSFLQNYFALGNYDFGQDLSYSALMSEVMQSVEGIKSLRILSPEDIVVPWDGYIFTLGTVEFGGVA